MLSQQRPAQSDAKFPLNAEAELCWVLHGPVTCQCRVLELNRAKNSNPSNGLPFSFFF